MLELLRKIGRLRIVVLTSLAILLPFLAYNFIYVSNQTGYYTDRNFRILANFSNSVKERVESLRSVSEYAAKAAVTYGATSKEGFGTFLDALRTEGTNLTAIDVKPAALSQDAPDARTAVTLKSEGGSIWLYFGTDISQVAGSGAGRVISAPAAGKPGAWRFETKAKLDDVLGTIAINQIEQEHRSTEHKGGFDVLLISELSGDARVIYQQSAGGFILTNMNTLSSPDDESKKLSVADLGTYTNSADVKFAGTSYKLFTQPIELNVLGEGDKSTSLVACGLVQATHFRHETWAIPPPILITFGFVMALLVLSWPFLKLYTLGPKDRVRLVDVYLLGFSMFITMSLLTLFLLYLYTYHNLDGQVRQQLKDLAQKVQSNFQAEVRDALQEVAKLNHPARLGTTYFDNYLKYCLGIKDQKNAKDIKNYKAGCNFEMSANQRSKILPELLDQQPPDSYPFFSAVFWTDQNGQQAAKWTVRDQRTAPINVSFRQYFRDVRAGRLRTLDTFKFTVEPIISKTTGGSEAVIAVPDPSRPGWVSGVNARLLSVMQPVVPPGYGFAIIDDAGTVLFHSEGVNHFGENLFIECDNNRFLRSAVLGHTEEVFDSRYLGLGHSLYVQPFSPMPWTIVTFSSKEYLRTTFSEILTLSLLLFFFYSFALLLIFALIFVLSHESEDGTSWLWPDPRRAKTYFGSLLVVITLMGASFALTNLSGLGAFIAPASLALLGLCLFVLMLMKGESLFRGARVRRHPPRLWRSLDHRHVYMLGVTTLFVLTGVIPAYSCFKLAYDEEARLLVKGGQVSLAKGLAEREERVRSQYTTDMFGEEKDTRRSDRVKQFMARRLYQSLDTYDSFFFDTKISTGGAPRADLVDEDDNSLVDFFKSYVPLFNQTSVERQAYVHALSADGLWRWRKGGDVLVLQTPVGASQDRDTGDGIDVDSAIPVMGYLLFWIGAFPALYLVSFLLVKFVVRRIYLTGLTCGAAKSIRSILSHIGSQNVFLVMTPPCLGSEDGSYLPSHSIINLRDYDGGNGSTDPATHAGSVGGLVIIEDFGYLPGDAEANERRLNLLERLRREKKRVIAISSLDPETHVLTAAAEVSQSPPGGQAPNNAWRWVSLMTQFVKVPVADSAGEGIPNMYFKRARQRLLPNKSSKAEAKRVERVLACIRRECGASAYLQRIGISLIYDPDLRHADKRWVVDKVSAQASVFYRVLYDSCSACERLTLFHLAQDKLVAPKDPDVRRLFERRLIVRDPVLRVMNDSFRLYVLAKGKAEGLDKREALAAESSYWEALKLPLGIVIACVILFLFLTQRDLYNSTLAVITAVTAGIPSVFKLLDLLQRDAGGRTPADRTL
jgi:hypothetical protein